jgi:hypothetical protein
MVRNLQRRIDMKRTHIVITLTAANMGPNAEEPDYEAWADYVTRHIDSAMGFVVEDVDRIRWGRPMPAEDAIDGATEDQAGAIQRWLSNEGWDAFCSERDHDLCPVAHTA